ncbi:MAG: hypothetical protein ACI3W5_07495 [Faecousia sp.]
MDNCTNRVETVQIIRWLREHAKEAQHPSWARMMNAAADRLSETAIKVETNIYDREEIHKNCTVQVLTNSVTGEVSIGWWRQTDSPKGHVDKY